VLILTGGRKKKTHINARVLGGDGDESDAGCVTGKDSLFFLLGLCVGWGVVCGGGVVSPKKKKRVGKGQFQAGGKSGGTQTADQKKTYWAKKRGNLVMKPDGRRI